jgi:hypothetical protein
VFTCRNPCSAHVDRFRTISCSQSIQRRRALKRLSAAPEQKRYDTKHDNPNPKRFLWEVFKNQHKMETSIRIQSKTNGIKLKWNHPQQEHHDRSHHHSPGAEASKNCDLLKYYTDNIQQEQIDTARNDYTHVGVFARRRTTTSNGCEEKECEGKECFCTRNQYNNKQWVRGKRREGGREGDEGNEGRSTRITSNNTGAATGSVAIMNISSTNKTSSTGSSANTNDNNAQNASSAENAKCTHGTGTTNRTCSIPRTTKTTNAAGTTNATKQIKRQMPQIPYVGRFMHHLGANTVYSLLAICSAMMYDA